MKDLRCVHVKKYLTGFTLLLAFFLRLVLIHQSFWLDEAAQILESMRPLNQQLQIDGDFQPPLFHIVVHFFAQASLQEWWLRMSSVISGVGTVFFTYLIGKYASSKLTNKSFLYTGELAALFLSLSSFHIFYSQELRPYALATLFGTASWYFLLKLIDQKKSNTRLSISYILSTVLGLYTMYLYPFLFLSQLVFVWFARSDKRKLIATLAFLASLFFLPWIPMFLKQLKTGTTLQTVLPGWSSVVSDSQLKALLHVWMRFVSGVQTYNGSWLDLLLLGFPSLIALIWCFVFFHKTKTHLTFRFHVLFVFYWIFISVGFSWFVSFVIPVISPKRVLFALPAFYLLSSFATLSLPDKLKKTLIALFIMMQVVGVFMYWTNPQLQREGWKDVIGTIYERFSPSNTVVLFGFQGPFAPWEFYAKNFQFSYKTIPLTNGGTVTQEILDERMPQTLSYSHVLVFDYLLDLTDPQRTIEQWLTQNGFIGVESIPTRNLGFVRHFGVQYIYADSSRD